MPGIKYVDDAGTFEGVVEQPESGWFGEAGDNATPYIRIPVRVAEAGSLCGAITIYKGWLSEAAFDRTIATLKSVFGFDGDLQALADNKVTLAGLPCQVVTKFETYNNKQLCRAAFLNPPGGGGAKQLDPGKVSSLVARLASRAKAIAKNTEAHPAAGSPPAPKPGTPTVPTDGPPGEDDDVPF